MIILAIAALLLIVFGNQISEVLPEWR